MYPKTHVLLGFVLSLTLFLFCDKINLLAAIIIFLSSFLIDFDHYIFFAFVFKQKNIFKAYSLAKKIKKGIKKLSRKQRKEIKTSFYLFHGIEALAVLFLLGYFIHDLFYFILIGMAFHLILDHIEIFSFNIRIHKISTIFDYICFRKANKNFKK